jgi:hypothetical protein
VKLTDVSEEYIANIARAIEHLGRNWHEAEGKQILQETVTIISCRYMDCITTKAIENVISVT